MNDIAEVHRRALGGFRVAYEQELSAYRQAEYCGDADEQARAAQAMAGYRASMRELNAMASEAISMRQAPPLAGGDELSRRDVELVSRYGLSAHEIPIAKNWTSDPGLTDEAKVQNYVANRQRYRAARADGSYRDDQGRVTR